MSFDEKYSGDLCRLTLPQYIFYTEFLFSAGWGRSVSSKHGWCVLRTYLNETGLVSPWFDASGYNCLIGKRLG